MSALPPYEQHSIHWQVDDLLNVAARPYDFNTFNSRGGSQAKIMPGIVVPQITRCPVNRAYLSASGDRQPNLGTQRL